MRTNSFQIAVMPGEGIGPEVMNAALAVLEASSSGTVSPLRVSSCRAERTNIRRPASR